MRQLRWWQLTSRGAARDILHYAPAKVLPALINVVAVAAYTRALHPGEYGDYVLALTTITLLSSTLFGWISSAALRFWGNAASDGGLRELLSNLLFTQVFLYALTAVVAYSGLWVWGDHLEPRLLKLIQFGILVLGINVSYTLVISIIRAERQTARFAIYSFLYALAGLVLAMAAILWLRAGPAGPLWGMLLAGAIIVLVELTVLTRRIGLDLSTISRARIAEYARYGVPLIGVGFSTMILSDSDRYLIAYFRDTAQAGLYGAVYGVANNSLAVIMSVLVTAAFPVVVQRYEREGEAAASRFLSTVTALFLIVLIPAVAGVVVLSRDILGVLLPKEYLQANGIVPWVAAGIFCYGATNVVACAFMLKKRTASLMYFIVIAAGINVAMNVVLIPRFGIIGAAASTFAAYVAYLTLAWFRGIRLMPVAFPWAALWKATLAASAMVAAIRLLQTDVPALWSLIAKVIVGAAVYVLCLLVLRERLLKQTINMGFHFVMARLEGT